jgi:histidine ammonia-lyase
MFEIPIAHLTLKDLFEVANNKSEIKLKPQALKKINTTRKIIDQIIEKGQVAYGINTGFGALAEITLGTSRLKKLQKNLILSHSVGWGNDLPQEVVRGAMFLRANMLTKGYSGVRKEVIETLIKMLNNDIVPAVPETGSVGASGDLSPLAFVALAMLGVGEVYYRHKKIPARQALKKAQIKPLELESKEGLALINGTEVMAAASALMITKSQYLSRLADLVSAMSVVALQGETKPFDLTLMKLKPHPGQIIVAQNLKKLLSGYAPQKSKVQDPYSLRCIPQINGAAREGINFAQRIVETEINSVTDNPVIITSSPKDEYSIISGGNFHGQALALAIDTLGIALTTLGVSSERRSFRLLDPTLSGLSAFLVPNPGENSGLMMLQVLQASLCAENKVLSTPASIHSVPTSASQEDLVSMGMTAVLKAQKILKNTFTILAIELLLARQAIELAQYKLPPKLERFYRILKERIRFIDKDRLFQEDLTVVHNILTEKEFKERVENEIL